jgi:hypothetical protein
MYILIYLFLSFVFSQDDYFQVIDQVSFNLRDKSSHLKFLNDYNIEGSAMLMDNHIKLTPKLNNTYGLIYSKEQIHSSNIRIHLTMEINHEPHLGSSLVLWLFKDDLEESNLRNFVGFKGDYNGIGMMIMTPQVSGIKFPRTLMYGKRNYGKVNETEDRIAVDFNKKSCYDNFHNVITRVTFDIQDGKINIYNTNDESLNSNCLTSGISMNIKPPYRIALSSYNGIIDGQQYMDSVEIYKLSVLNKEYENRLLYKVDNSAADNSTNIYRKGEVYINLQHLEQLGREISVLATLLHELINTSAHSAGLKQIHEFIGQIRVFAGRDNIDNDYNYLLDKLYTFNFTLDEPVRHKYPELEEYLLAFNNTSGRIIADYEEHIFPYKRTKLRVLVLMLPLFAIILYVFWKILSDRLIKMTKTHED